MNYTDLINCANCEHCIKEVLKDYSVRFLCEKGDPRVEIDPRVSLQVSNCKQWAYRITVPKTIRGN